MTPEQIATITKHYAFTPDDHAALTGLLATAYLHAKQAAYQRAHTTVGHRVSLPVWRPGDADATKAHDWAYERVAGIADTYEGLLKSHLEQLPEDETRETGDKQKHDMLGNVLAGIGIAVIVKKIVDWFMGFLPWKTEQIAQDAWSEGDNDGTEQFVNDVRDSGIDYSTLKVRVDPSESSSDYCKEYAGNTYDFDAIGVSVPHFPSHSRCIHYLVVLTADGDEVSI